MERNYQQARSFLDLPPKIRENIYLQAGLPTGCQILLNKDKEHRHWKEHLVVKRHSRHLPGDDFEDLTYDCVSYLSLIQVCRKVYLEISSLLYSRNRFIVHYFCTDGLKPLSLLSATSIASLTELVVRLELLPSCACWSETKLLQREPEMLEPTYDYLLNNLPGIRWQAISQRLMRYIVPSRCRFTLTGRPTDDTILAAMLQPFYDGLRFAKYHIIPRGLQPPSARLLACNASLIAEGTQPALPSTQPFRFFDLPYDIRRIILECADLVTPTREVRWILDTGFEVLYPTAECDSYNCLSAIHEKYCMYRTCVADWMVNDLMCCPLENSTSPMACMCWNPPVSVMLVNKRLTDEARAVFFSMNRFIIFDRTFKEDSYEARRVAELPLVFEFLLRGVPNSALGSLRSIEFVVPQVREHYFDIDMTSDEYKDFVQSFILMSKHLTLPHLTVSMSLAPHALGRIEGEPQRHPSTKTEGFEEHAAIIGIYTRLFQPFIALTGLGRFFVLLNQLTCDHCFSIANEAKRKFDFNHSGFEDLEHLLERFVMGPNYDSKVLGGKDKVWRREWRCLLATEVFDLR